MTAAFSAEATEASDNTPVLAQPTCDVEKAQAFVPFSIEIGEDWVRMQVELAKIFRRAKDALEAVQFVTGLGHSHVPEGLLVGATAIVTSAGTATIGIGDVYSLKETLAPTVPAQRDLPRVGRHVRQDPAAHRPRQHDGDADLGRRRRRGPDDPAAPAIEHTGMVTTLGDGLDPRSRTATSASS